MVAWSDHDQAYDRAEARGEVDDAPTGGWYESWQQDDVFGQLADAVSESARLSLELASLVIAASRIAVEGSA